MNYFERHLGDYARDAGHLSMLEHGAYTMLLDRYYTTERGIPQDQAHRICRVRSKDERAAVDAVLCEFFTLRDGLWINGRAEREVCRMQSKIEAARSNGKRGGRPKINPDDQPEKPSGLLLGSVLVTQEKALQSPDTSNQEKTKTARKRASPAAHVSVDDLVAQGVEKQHAQDWLAARKVKSLPLTLTALEQTKGEAIKAGLSLPSAIKTAAGNGWAGFKASWLTSDSRDGSAVAVDPFSGAH